MELLRSAIASAAAVLAAVAAAHGLTRGFRAWTAEDARRLEVALHPVPAPALAVAGPALPATPLAALLSRDAVPTIADFGYTRCETVCAALGSVFQQLQAAILQGGAAMPPVRLLTLSFDPAYDDDAVLARYAARLRADARIWRFVRAAPGADTRELLDRFRVTVIDDGRGGWEHNAALLVIDGSGRLVRVFDYTEQARALAFARSLSMPAAASP